MSKARSEGVLRTMLVVVFLSGISCLIYEVLWSRMLMVVFGTSTFAVSTVLAAYMAGLALGSVLFGHWADGPRRLLRTYGILELGVGLYSLFLPALLHGLLQPYASWAGGLTESFYLRSLLRFGLGFLILLPVTTLIGGLIPTAARFVLARGGGIADRAGRLYSLNTLGSVVGTLLTGFLLIRLLGTRNTTWTAAALNSAIGLVALSYSLITREKPQPARPATASGPIFSPRGKLLLGLYAVSGFAALGYQVLWTRILVFILGNRIYAFSTILAVFLGGLALGSYAAARWADRLRDPGRAFGLVELGIAASALAGLPLFMRLGLLEQMFQSWLQPNWGSYLLLKFIIAGAPLLLPTFLMGATYPLAIRLLVSDRSMAGRGLGYAAGWNTVGAILGAFAGGFVLVPIFSVAGSIRILAGLSLGIGLAGVALLARTPVSRQRSSQIALVAILGIAWLSRGPLILDPVAREMPETVKYYREGMTATVSVLTKPGHATAKMLRINGISEVPTDLLGMQVFKMLGHLPLLLHPNPRDVLVITFGGGIASGSIARHPGIQVDVVEICPEVLEAAGTILADENNHVLDQPNVTVHIEDGRNYLLTDRRHYDILSCDATHPTAVDSWVLFTREFYQLVREHLRPGGRFIQWIPMHEMTDLEYRTTLRTLSSVFPSCTLWLVEPSDTRGHTLVVAGNEPFQPDRSRIVAALEDPAVRADLARYGLDHPDIILGYYALGPEELTAYVAGLPISTDDHPILAFPAAPFQREAILIKLQGIQRIKDRRLHP